MDIILGIVTAVFIILGLRSKPTALPDSLSDDKKDKLKEDLEVLEKKEARIRQDGVDVMSDEEVLSYWDDVNDR